MTKKKRNEQTRLKVKEIVKVSIRKRSQERNVQMMKEKLKVLEKKKKLDS